MKNFRVLILVSQFVFLLSALSFAENIILLRTSAMPRTLDAASAADISGAVLENLHDSADILNARYITVPTLEKWVNTKIETINATNTNMIVVRKRMLRPRKIRPVSLRAIAPTTLKTINRYVKLGGVLLVGFNYTGKKTGPATVNITFTLYNNLGLKISSAVAPVPVSLMADRGAVNRRIKEALITVFNLWARYDYQQKISGVLNVNLMPRAAKASFKTLNRVMSSGRNNDVPYGSYVVLVSAPGYVTLLTNVAVTAKVQSFRATLQRFNPASLQPGAPPVGNLYVESDYPNAKFTVLEENITARTPALLTNMPASERTIVFDETPDYYLRKYKTAIAANDTVYEIIRLERKGSGFRVLCNVEGANVVMDRDMVGVVSNGRFEFNAPSGLHGITVMKDRFESFRTNLTLSAGETIEMTANLTPRKVPGLVISAQSDGAEVLVDFTPKGVTPAALSLDPSENYKFILAGTNVGYYNFDTNMPWAWNRDNNLLAVLRPLYGDIRVFSAPDDVSVAIDDLYRGKTTASGLALYQLPAKIVKLRLEKEGYRPLVTNVYLAPNVESKFTFVLKEAPGRLFITTSPEKGFDVFLNGDFVGLSGAGVVSSEFGAVHIRLKKRGFKTIQTNIGVSNSTPVVLNFSTEPGTGVDEFMDSVIAVYRQGMILVEMEDLDGAVKQFRIAKEMIENSGQDDQEEVKEMLEKVVFQLKRYGVLAEVNDLVDTGDLNMDKELYDLAIQNYGDAVTLLDKSEIIKINQKVKELRKLVHNKLKRAERLKIKPEKYWPKMTRNWSGVSFDLMAADISQYGTTVYASKMNLPLYFRVHWTFLPIMGINVGGMYNFLYLNPSLRRTTDERYLFYALTFGADLRLPLLPSWAFFAEYNFVVSDFSTFNVTENATINGGFDLKFGYFGVKLFYNACLSQNFRRIHHGFGLGFSVWITEE